MEVFFSTEIAFMKTHIWWGYSLEISEICTIKSKMSYLYHMEVPENWGKK